MMCVCCLQLERSYTQLPHRPAETWRKHWASSCEVPDALYIAARKRADSESALAREDPRGESPLTPLAARDTSDGSSESSESEPDASDDEQSAYRPPSARTGKPAARGPSATNAATTTETKARTRTRTRAKTARRGPSRHAGGVLVTDEDLRAMARYKFARRGFWENPNVSHKAFWRDFACRPEVSAPSLFSLPLSLSPSVLLSRSSSL